MTITTIRLIASTNTELGVGEHNGSWYVFVREPEWPWTMHTGPYATEGEALEWVNELREV